MENSFYYDGYRATKTVDGLTTSYLYEGDRVIKEVDTEDRTVYNVYGTMLISREVDNDKVYYLYNGHGDVTALLTAGGTVLASYYYDAFGNIVDETGSFYNPIRYAGYTYDPESGLYDLKARYYDPKIARFMQEDTYWGSTDDTLSLNLYTYCVNKPLTYYDPTGHAGTPVDIILPTGRAATGYVENGVTYYNEERVANGTVVYTNGGTYMMLNGKGVSVYVTTLTADGKTVPAYIVTDTSNANYNSAYVHSKSQAKLAKDVYDIFTLKTQGGTRTWGTASNSKSTAVIDGSAVTMTPIWDVNGLQQTGYIKDGTTYLNMGCTVRVPDGTTVLTNNGY